MSLTLTTGAQDGSSNTRNKIYSTFASKLIELPPKMKMAVNSAARMNKGRSWLIYVSDSCDVHSILELPLSPMVHGDVKPAVQSTKWLT